MNRYLFSQFIIGIVVLALFGCNRVSSDPKEGAIQLMRLLSKCAAENDFKKANSLMSDYWHSYDDEQLKDFLFTLRDELMTNDDVVEFIVESDFEKYPMCGLYMRILHQFAYGEAKMKINQITISSISKSANGISFTSKSIIS